MQLVILAGGKGSRLQGRLGSLPKPLVDICGRPLIEHQVALGVDYAVEEAVLLTGYGASAIEKHFASSNLGVKVRTIEESSPLGSAGAVIAALPSLDERFLVMYGDTMLNVDLDRFVSAHLLSGAAATLFLHPNDHPHDSDLVEVNADGRITAFHPYPHDPDRYYPNLVNAALYVIEKRLLMNWEIPCEPLDFAKHVFPAMLQRGAFLYGYRSPEYIKDAGTPERLDKVIADYRSGRVAAGSLRTPAPAVFLDRDGTLNEEVDRVKTPQELRVIDGVWDAIRLLNRSPYRCVVVTNQPVLARGDCSEEQLQEIHNKLETLLGRHGAYLDAIYYCPHHPHSGYPGEIKKLKIECSCRKPSIGLIEKACREMNLDLSRSWMIGDSTVDIKTARNAGIGSIVVGTGYAGRDGRFPDLPDQAVPDLQSAVHFILDSAERERS
jgi:histidinol-phosphate phosphatase family protein